MGNCISCILLQNETVPEVNRAVISDDVPVEQLRIRTPVYRPHDQEDPYDVNHLK